MRAEVFERPSADVLQSARRGSWSARLPVASAGVAVLASILVLATTGGALLDPDVGWHVRTGRLILDSGSVPRTDPWSFTTESGSWVPTAWLSDVLFAAVWHWGSWNAVRVLRVLMALLVVLAVWCTAHRNRGLTPATAIAAALVLVALAPFLRERPQVLSFLFVACLAVQADGILHGVMPRLVICVPVCWLWANLHGMWVLLPAIVLLCGVLAWIDDRRRVSLAARCTLVALLAWGVTLLTPVGPQLATWPLVVRDVAAPITEWQPTLPLTVIGLPLTVVLAVIVLSWIRNSETVSTGQLLYVTAVGLFGLLAFRNVAPASILLLPILCRSLSALLPRPGWQRTLNSRNAILISIPAVALALLGAGLRLVSTPTFDDSQPFRIVVELAGRPGEVLVLNHYDVGGLLTGLATPPVQVAIDGRTDLWSAQFVRSYLVDTSGGGDWRSLVDRLAPDAAVLPAGSEVARGLELERGWRVTLSDAGWQLLEPVP